MKKLFWGTVLLALVVVWPVPTRAGVDINIGISLPPAIVFGAPPVLIVLPDTYHVYVVPDIEVDIFFWDGWWWRPWKGRWYRSQYYHNQGWAYYDHVPEFYYDVDPGWRRSYGQHNWNGHRWYYERIPNRRLQEKWKSWDDNRYWAREQNWGVQGYQPRPQQQREELRHQREERYQQRPGVQRQQQERYERERQPQVQQPQHQERQERERQPQVQQPQQQHSEPRGQQNQEKSQHQKHEKGEAKDKK